ncbi:MAG: radical SAM protein, partial [Phascolarctobacterium sp.]|nr:radical SAM protein [Candidatus Phascolarctobacterium caballi]
AQKFSTREKVFKEIKKLPLEYSAKIKPSAFNYMEHKKNLYVVYNTLYCSTALLNRTEWQLLQNPNGEEKTLRELYAAGFLVPKNVNEFAKLQNYKTKIRKLWLKDAPLGLTIATTTKCNARCAYCFENNATREDVADGVEEQIKKFTDKHIGKNKQLNITWFGGEPLLNTAMIDRLTKYFLKKKYKLSAGIVTNGSLLTEKMLKTDFPKWKIKNMQITLDGTAKNYAKIKNYIAPELGNLDKVLKNIDLADKYKINTNIRLNVNKKNVRDLLKLAEQLDKRYADSKYVKWYMASLKGTESDYATEKELLSVTEKFMALNPKQISIKNTRGLPKIEFCMAEMPGAYCIDVNGDLKICWEDFTFSGNDIGNVHKFCSGKDKRNKQSKLQKKCEQCIWLPMCGGGCMALRTKNSPGCPTTKYAMVASLRQLIK